MSPKRTTHGFAGVISTSRRHCRTVATDQSFAMRAMRGPTRAEGNGCVRGLAALFVRVRIETLRTIALRLSKATYISRRTRSTGSICGRVTPTRCARGRERLVITTSWLMVRRIVMPPGTTRSRRMRQPRSQTTWHSGEASRSSAETQSFAADSKPLTPVGDSLQGLWRGPFPSLLARSMCAGGAKAAGPCSSEAETSHHVLKRGATIQIQRRRARRPFCGDSHTREKRRV
jgi:hypothetical protein